MHRQKMDLEAVKHSRKHRALRKITKANQLTPRTLRREEN
jgi:hypothetical protein